METSTHHLKGWQLLVIILVIIGMIVGGYLVYRQMDGDGRAALNTLPANTQLVTVQTGDIINSISASGEIAFSNREKLAFNVSGTVDQVNVEAGDSVKVGQVLARLESTSTAPLELAVAQARVNLKAAQDALTNAQTPYENADFNQAKLVVSTAQVSLKTAQDNLDKARTPYSQVDIDTALLAVANSRVALNTTQDTLDKTRTPYSQSDIDAARLAVASARVTLNATQDNLDKAQTPYSQSDVDAARLAVANAQVSLKTALDNLTKAQFPFSQSDIDSAKLAIINAHIALNSAQAAHDTALQNYTVNETDANFINFQQKFAQLNVAKDTLAAAQKTLADMQAAPDPDVIVQKLAAWLVAQNNLVTAQNNLDDMLAAPDPQVIAQKQAAVVVAQNNLVAAQDNLDDMLAAPDPQVIAQKQAAVVVAQNNLTKAQQDLADMLAAPDPQVVAQKQAALIVAIDNLAQAQKNLTDMVPDPLAVALQQQKVTGAQEILNDAIAALNTARDADLTIKAPYDGIMITVNIQSGQKAAAGANIMEVVSTATAQVNAVINEIDFASVKAGQAVSISIDALPNNTFTGSVSQLSVFGRTTQGVVSYPVTISVDAQTGVQLGEGMSATATIIFSQVNNVLIISNRAIAGTAANPTVSVFVNGTLEARAVSLGLTDGTQTQVISGLQAGDRVLEASVSTNRGLGGGQFAPGGAVPAGGGQIFRSVGGG